MTKKKGGNNTCGKRVKIARISNDMNQLQLATALNVDSSIDVNQHSISMIERGERFVKDFELLALAEILDIHPMWLLFGDDLPEKYAYAYATT